MQRDTLQQPTVDQSERASDARPTRRPVNRKTSLLGSLLLLSTLAAGSIAGTAGAAHAARSLFAPTLVGSTKPANGDLNPYGVAIVPRTIGNLVQGNVLVSNFNNAQNLAGTGTTIDQISPSGNLSTFAQINPNELRQACPGGGVGLTTALTVLKRGYVIVGSLPTTDGTPATLRQGCLLVLNPLGRVISTISAPDINGPWDMTALDQGSVVTLFVSNVLNGTQAAQGQVTNQGTVVRLVLRAPINGAPQVLSNTIIGSGFAEKTDPAALVFGPTGLGLGQDGTLYVADTLENRISAIPSALTRTNSANSGKDLTAGGALNGPLGLAIAPNGDILSVNANDGNLVETTIAGTQVMTDTISTAGNPPGAGALFGLAVAPNGDVFFGDDNATTLNRWAGSGDTNEAVASLFPQANSGVSGVAFLVKHKKAGTVEIFMQVTGLAPNSVHPTHIHLGSSCSAMGPILFPLPNLQANAQGAGIIHATIHSATISSSNWYINIHQGIGMDASLACGSVMPTM
ncbi:MAG TPA: CHRD domain-containing protein [Chloroflexota bacterium]|nr:CHRD domain-containing protein [Chloroflexota bacterium]